MIIVNPSSSLLNVSIFCSLAAKALSWQQKQSGSKRRLSKKTKQPPRQHDKKTAD